MPVFDITIKNILDERLGLLEKHFQGDVAFYYGNIVNGIEKWFRDNIEKLKENASHASSNRFVLFLNTPGGSAEIVEKLVEIIRHHYEEVYFVIPDCAMSAGTIFCMSGDKIYMDYSSSLGPIDPQFYNGKEFVPALGYLDQVEKLLEKAKINELTNAEFLILQNQDLAMLSRYEQQKNLTITLLKKWLVDYKFRNWTQHRSSPSRKDQDVTPEEKEGRAQEIAECLSDNKRWHSHGRLIGIKTLKDVVKLEIEDYSQDVKLKKLIRDYNELLTEYISRNQLNFFFHTRYCF